MFIKRAKTEYLVFAVALFVHCLFLIPMKAPMIIDEYLSFTNAAFLSGQYDWSNAYSSLPKIAYYGWGMTPLYVLAFLFSDNMFTAYKIALLINAIFMSYIGVLAIKIFKNASRESGTINQFLIVFAVISYGPYLYLSKGVWNECGILFIPWLVLYLLQKVYANKCTGIKYFVFHFFAGFCSAYAYAISGRGLALLATTVLIYIYIIIQQKNARGLLFFGGAIGIVLYTNKTISDYLVDNLLIAETSVISNLNVNLASRLSTISIQSVFSAIAGYFGNFFYIACASLGIIIIGILLLVYNLVTRKRITKISFIAIFSYLYLIIDMGQVFVSSYKKYALSDYSRGDYFMYGRYFDSTIPLCIFSTILLLEECKIIKKIHISYIAIFTIIMSITCKLVIPAMLDNGKYLQALNIGVINTLSLNLRFWKSPTSQGYLTMILVLIALFGICAFLLFKRKVLTFCIILIIFNICTGYSTMKGYAWSTSISKYDNLQKYITIFNDIETEFKDIYYISRGGRAINIHFVLPEYNLQQLNIYIYGEEVLATVSNKNCFLMSNSDEKYETFIEDCYKIKDTGSIYLWVYGNDLMNDLAQQGVDFYANTSEGSLSFVDYANSFTYTPLNSSNYRKCFRAMGNNSMYGASWYYLGTDSYLMSDPVKMSPGSYTITVDGENLNANLILQDSEGNIVDFDYKTTHNDNQIVYTFALEEPLYNATIYIMSNVTASLTDEHIMRIKQVKLTNN